MLHKNFRRYTEKVFLILCQKIGFDITNLHEMLKPIFWENKKNINLSSADFTQTVVKVKVSPFSRLAPVSSD